MKPTPLNATVMRRALTHCRVEAAEGRYIVVNVQTGRNVWADGTQHSHAGRIGKAEGWFDSHAEAMAAAGKVKA